MEELQSWWEVPAIAHFCHIFRAAFNLFYMEISELESAILQVQAPDLTVSLEQIVTRLLQGCYEPDDEVTEFNWEEKLQLLFELNCKKEQNPFIDGTPFLFLPPRTKVEILLKLCEFRLDADDAAEAIKDISSEDMQAKCIGKDGLNAYWYFYDERLYKEDTTKAGLQRKKKTQMENLKLQQREDDVKARNVKKAKNLRNRKPKEDASSAWSIVCNSVADWEMLVTSLTKSRSSLNKQLVYEIKKNYLPKLKEVGNEKEKLLRERSLEPKRTSSRITKGKAQKKLEAQNAAKEEQRKYEDRQLRKRELKKRKEIEERSRRAAERLKLKAKEGRASRAKLRGNVKEFTEFKTYSNDVSRTQKQVNSRVAKNKVSYSQDETSEESDDIDEEEESDDIDEEDNSDDIDEEDNSSSSENVQEFIEFKTYSKDVPKVQKPVLSRVAKNKVSYSQDETSDEESDDDEEEDNSSGSENSSNIEEEGDENSLGNESDSNDESKDECESESEGNSEGESYTEESNIVDSPSEQKLFPHPSTNNVKVLWKPQQVVTWRTKSGETKNNHVLCNIRDNLIFTKKIKLGNPNGYKVQRIAAPATNEDHNNANKIRKVNFNTPRRIIKCDFIRYGNHISS